MKNIQWDGVENEMEGFELSHKNRQVQHNAASIKRN